MDQHIGSYRLDHLIGQGATGEVWLAWDEGHLRRPVAVKRVRLEGGTRAVSELTVEAELLAGIHHPHLVPVVAVVSDGDGLAIVMPYLAGGSLAALLEERGTLGPGEVVALLEPLADAVDALGRRGIVHGDLKPGNVVLTGDGEPVLVDVGIARVAARRAVEARSGSFAGSDASGTPEYLDPSVAQGGDRGVASEVYALGVLAYECLTGRVPHRGEPAEVVAVAAAGVHRRLHSWPTVPDAVADVVETALDPDPTRRPADASRFAAELRAAVQIHAAEEDGPDPIALPGITRRALAAPATAAGRHTVVVDQRSVEVDDPASSGPRGWVRRTIGAVAAAAVVAVVIVGSQRSPGRAGADAPSDDPVSSAAAASATAPAVTQAEPPDGARSGEQDCDPPPAPGPASPPESAAGRSAVGGSAGEVSVVEVDVDVDGDGCPERTRWDGHQLTVTGSTGVRAYRIGRPGDQVLFGDWDGDGATTPALYRPTTGEVLYVDRFPEAVGDRETAVSVEHLAKHGTAMVRQTSVDDGDAVDRVVLVDGA